MSINSKSNQFINLKGPGIALVIMLLIFLTFSGYMALNLKPGIIPDEPAHFAFSKHFASTWGLPPDTPDTFGLGIYIEQNPFLYYWISGRIINLIDLLKPGATEWQTLLTLRIINVVFAAGTVLICFLLSKEVIKHPWWQLIPVILLTNTLMYVFLAAGVNYDNLANLLTMSGLLFFTRVFTRKDFLFNSSIWMIFISMGTLVKYTILPLALAMGIAWLIYTFIHRKEVFPVHFDGIKTLLLLLVLFALFTGNFLIYGINLIRYDGLLPECEEILLESQCALSPLELRYQEKAIKPKMTIRESIAKGYPNPFSYAVNTWVHNMLLRTFGMIGHQSYFPLDLVRYYKIVFYGAVLMGLFFLKPRSALTYSLVGISIFYALVLLFSNYNNELEYGFIHIGFQGRYIFPVIGPISVLFTLIAKNILVRLLRMLFLGFTLGLFFIGGPITILLKYQEVFSSWFF
ncbi:MAG: hypothetical protein SCH68_02190 [Brevefilum sp.]|nr:hypothetical protein [Brevefilum sp.]